MVEKPSHGKVLDLSSIDRRKFIRGTAALGTGTAALQAFIGRVYGEEPDGVPLVHTYNTKGEPEKVRIVSKERYRRIMALEDLPESFLEKDHINGASIISLGNKEEDIGIEVMYSEDSEATAQDIKKEAKSHVENIPVVTTETSYESRADSCNERSFSTDTLEGGLEVGGDGYGTLTIGCFRKSDGSPLVVASDHVMDGDDKMYQPEGGQEVAELHERSKFDSGEDVTSYTVNSGISVDHRAVFALPDLTGVWTFSGLTDQTENSGSVPCTLSGVNSCTVDNSAEATTYFGTRVLHEVEMAERNAGDGDSGGPWVDDDNKLVAVHSGTIAGTNDKWDIASAGDEALDAVDATLYYSG